MMAEWNAWTDDQLKTYNFPIHPLPICSVNDPQAEELIKEQKPVVIKGSELISTAQKWDLEYLREHIGDGEFTVYESDSESFKYYDDKKVIDGFTPPMKQRRMIFSEFYDAIKNKNRTKKYYLQQPLNDKVGPQIVVDFINFNWKWIKQQQMNNNWGPLTSNLLLISEEGNVTPCHYDEQENFYSQANGYKRVILFPPSQYKYLYPHPVYHPHDRQSQVDFDEPNLKLFPKFKKVVGFGTVLGPGDVLYLPSYWFHYFETLKNSGIATAITFWYKAAPVGNITYPLTAVQLMAMMRNTEKMILEALKDYKQVDIFWNMLAAGRYCKDVQDDTDDEDAGVGNDASVVAKLGDIGRCTGHGDEAKNV
ncbi:hypothetical protein HELRODRAFT_189263 [Helobdella robusta]|uniref:JmjC domain-containing protein n=1 Tax=Helobdella robusta TaxID=6412 RepID=T1FQW0_HELRO|nr:hypothetical protein HELRODRAFT_189263 [Helobdella robusta]ESN96481.1 hypothetical protein HELRODRAFT_189263 [Helobdella robusta]